MLQTFAQNCSFSLGISFLFEAQCVFSMFQNSNKKDWGLIKNETFILLQQSYKGASALHMIIYYNEHMKTCDQFTAGAIIKATVTER